MRCDRALATVIHPTETVIKENNWPKIVLAIRFPYPEGIAEVVVEGCLRFLRVIASDKFALGVKFEQFKDDGAKHFNRFIEESLRPVE